MGTHPEPRASRCTGSWILFTQILLGARPDPRVSDCADSHSGRAVTRDGSIPHVDQVAWRGRVFTLFRAYMH